MKCISAHAPDQQLISLTVCGKKLLMWLLEYHVEIQCENNALHHTTVEGPEDADGERGLFQLPQQRQSLLGLFRDPWGVFIPAQVVRDLILHSEELDVLHSLHWCWEERAQAHTAF